VRNSDASTGAAVVWVTGTLAFKSARVSQCISLIVGWAVRPVSLAWYGSASRGCEAVLPGRPFYLGRVAALKEPHEMENKAKSEVNGFVYVAVGVAAIGGLLFGYDTGVISGAIIFVERQFSLSATMEEIVVSSVLAGAVLGAIRGY